VSEKRAGYKLRGAPPPRHSGTGPVTRERRDPGNDYLQQEIDDSRKFEWLLVPKALLALLFVGILVAIRLIWFQ
jgi:hypothetical protein